MTRVEVMDIEILRNIRDCNSSSRLTTDWRGDDLEQWRGVSRNADGHVTELYASVQALHGGAPPFVQSN